MPVDLTYLVATASWRNGLIFYLRLGKDTDFATATDNLRVYTVKGYDVGISWWKWGFFILILKIPRPGWLK